MQPPTPFRNIVLKKLGFLSIFDASQHNRSGEMARPHRIQHRIQPSIQGWTWSLCCTVLLTSVVLLSVGAGAASWTWSYASAHPNHQTETGTLSSGTVQEVRTILPSEWGVPFPAGLSYSLARGQIALLNKRDSAAPQGDKVEVVVITPYEELIASSALSATITSTINLAYDDGSAQLLLLDRQQNELLQLPLAADGAPNPAALARVNVAHLALVHAAGMEVDHLGRQLLILDSGTLEIVRANLDAQSALLSKIDLAHLGPVTLRGLALHPRTGHLFVVEPDQNLLFELNPDGQLVRSYDLAALNLVDARGLAFGPSTDLTDDPGVYHLFMADSNLPDTLPTGAPPTFGRVLELRLDANDLLQTLVVQAAASSDDSEETIASGATTVDSSDLELGQTANGEQIVGLHFGPLSLPTTAIIRSAVIEFTTDEKGDLPTSLLIQGEAADSAAPFAEPNSDISRRLRTGTSVPWPDVAPWIQIGEAHQTPNVAPIVQEILARPGWTNGNAMAFFITGAGQRIAEAYDGEPLLAPRLIIEYALPAPTPTVTATSPVTSPVATPTSTVITTTRFAVIGDYGSNNVNEARVATLVDSWNPDYVITTGDNNYPDGEAITIDDSVGQYYSHYLGNYTGAYGPGSTVNRFWPTLGNHDWNTLTCNETGCSGAYFDYFTLPNNERYYDVDLGLVHLFALDSESEEPDGRNQDSIQAAWLRDQLAASTACHNVVYFHRAPYSSGKHGSSAIMQWPFAQWGADVVLSAHDHSYERLDVGGMAYFVNGAGGANLYEWNSIADLPPEATSVVRYNQDHGAMLVTATDAGITYQFYNAENLLIDEYRVAKQCATTVPIPEPTATQTVTPTVTPIVLPTVMPTPTPGSAKLRTIHVPGDAATIQEAIDLAGDGDVVLVGPGEYRENIQMAGKTIILASHFYTTNDASQIEQTIIDGGGSTVITVDSSVGPETKIIGFTIQNGDDGISPAAKLHILNNRFMGNRDGIDYEGGGGFCLNNLFENNSDDGIDLDGASEVTIENNLIRNNRDDGIEVRLQPYRGPTLNIVIRNNLISGNQEDGIQLIGYDELTDRSFLIERNAIMHNAMAGLGLMDNQDTGEDFRGASLLERIYLFNNTFVDNGYGLTGGDNLLALNNLFVGSPALALKNVDGGSLAAHTLFWANATDYQNSNVDMTTTLRVDPRLDADGHLLAESPAIDAGTAFFEWHSEVVLDLQPADYGGLAPDLGAHETAVTPRGGATDTPIGKTNLLYLPTVLK